MTFKCDFKSYLLVKCNVTFHFDLACHVFLGMIVSKSISTEIFQNYDMTSIGVFTLFAVLVFSVISTLAKMTVQMYEHKWQTSQMVSHS